MNAKDAIRQTIAGNHGIMKMFLADLSDADILVRPVEHANHIAWQLGHLIVSETRQITAIPGGRPAELPADFAGRHDKNSAGSDTGFDTLAKYLELADRVNAASLATLDAVADDVLDQPSPVMPQMCPTIGALFLLIANHKMMHAGQFSVVRRKLGKPVLF